MLCKCAGVYAALNTSLSPAQGRAMGSSYIAHLLAEQGWLADYVSWKLLWRCWSWCSTTRCEPDNATGLVHDGALSDISGARDEPRRVAHQPDVRVDLRARAVVQLLQVCNLHHWPLPPEVSLDDMVAHQAHREGVPDVFTELCLQIQVSAKDSVSTVLPIDLIDLEPAIRHVVLESIPVLLRVRAQLLATQQEVVAAVEDTMLTVLMLMKRHYTESRVIKMLDSAGAPAWKAISNTDIVDNPEIYVDGNTLFKLDAANRESRVLEMTQLGLMTPEEARDAISFRTFDKRITEEFIQISHFKDMLQAVIMGQKIQVLPTDNLEAFTKVFTEFVQSTAYYDLPPETQDYIAQLIVDVNMFGAPEAQWQAASDMKTVSPHQSPKQTAPQMMPTAEPAQPPPPMEPPAMPTEGQNLPGLPSAISAMQGGGG